MPIATRCSAGHEFRVKDELAGKKIKCPKCGVAVQLPGGPEPAVARDVRLVEPQPSQPIEAELIEAELIEASIVIVSDAAHTNPTVAEVNPKKRAAETEVAATKIVETKLAETRQPSGPVVQPVASRPRQTQQPANVSSPAAARPQAASARPAPTPTPSSNMEGIVFNLLAFGGGSATAMFAVVLMMGWLLGGFRRADESGAQLAEAEVSSIGSETNETGTEPISVSPMVSASSKKNSAPVNQPEEVDPFTQPAKSSSAASEGKPDKPDKQVPPQSPLSLTLMESNDQVKSFQLPAPCRLSLYDAGSKRIFIGHEVEGLLAYDLSGLQNGKLSPSKTVPLGGEQPLSMCVKKHNGKRQLMVITEKTNLIHVLDADSLDEQETIKIKGSQAIFDIACSQSEADPYVYVLAESRKSINANQACLHQYNMEDKQTRVYGEITANLLAVSPDGMILDCSTNQMHRTYALTDSKPNLAYEWESQADRGRFVGDRLAGSERLMSADGAFVISQIPGRLYCELGSKPIAACWTGEGLQLLSANDYRPLETINLVGDWRNIRDTRTGGAFSEQLHQHELSTDDDQATLILRYFDRLAVVNLNDVELGDEVDLRPKKSVAGSLTVGQEQEYALGLPKGIQLEMAQGMQGLKSGNSFAESQLVGVRTLSELPPLPKLQREVGFQASELYFDATTGELPIAVPFTILLDDEPFEIRHVQKQQNGNSPLYLAITSRSQGRAHPAGTQARFPPERPLELPDKPTIAGDRITWKPALGSAGIRYMHLKATSGEVSRELVQRFVVQAPFLDVGFTIFGIKGDYTTERAVVWGRIASSGKGSKAWRAAVYDLRKQRQLSILEHEKMICAACLDKDSVYLALAQNGEFTEPMYMTDSMGASRQQPNCEIQSFDVNSFKPQRKANGYRRVFKMESIGGKRLLIDNEITFALPNLDSSANEDWNRPTQRKENGWVIKDILYDEELKKPLLSFTPQISGYLQYPPMTEVPQGEITRTSGVTSLAMINPSAVNTPAFGEYVPLTNYPASAGFSHGFLSIVPWHHANLRSDHPSERNGWKIRLDLEPYPLQNLRTQSRESAPIGCSDKHVVVGYAHKLFILPVNELLPTRREFEFPLQQERFILSAHKPGNISYKLPKAAKYELKIWCEPLNGSELGLVCDQTSSDGRFDLKIDEDWVVAVAKRKVANGRLDANAIKEYQTTNNPGYERLGGRKMAGIAIPAIASIGALHENGEQVCVLRHAFLIEVSLNAVMKEAQMQQMQRNNGNRGPR